MLRIANYHVGLRTTGPGFQTLRKTLAQLRTYETFFWYGFSSLLFCNVFLWSAPPRANLSWVTYFSGDRARLNERPLFLMSYMASCAIIQTINHYRKDTDRLVLGLSKNKNDGSNSLKVVLWKLPALISSSGTDAISAIPVALVLYYTVLRSFVWGWALMFLRVFYNLPKTNMLPPSWPTDLWLIFRCLHAGLFVFFIWNTGNFSFSTFMVEEPLKNGNPLTSESKDPNGSLLNGLKSKKLPIKVSIVSILLYAKTNFICRLSPCGS